MSDNNLNIIYLDEPLQEFHEIKIMKFVMLAESGSDTLMTGLGRKGTMLQG